MPFVNVIDVESISYNIQLSSLTDTHDCPVKNVVSSRSINLYTSTNKCAFVVVAVLILVNIPVTFKFIPVFFFNANAHIGVAVNSFSVFPVLALNNKPIGL